MSHAIEVRGLRKTYQVRERREGFGGAVRDLFRAPKRELVAVDDLSFAIAPGERVAFVGPNGAGKSTTIKILSGILHPSAGDAAVLGLCPWRDAREIAFRIGTVFGQRSQLWIHLPAADSFDLLARIYEIDPATYQRRRGEFVEAFGLGPLLKQPVRQLSLGQRMRCELVASLLHAPEILFLDEPTIGLDVTAKAVIRDLIREQSRREGRTLLFTSHDTGDMESVCDRVIVIHRGRILLDRPVAELRRSYIGRKRITLHSVAESVDLKLPGVEVIERRPHCTEVDVDLKQSSVERVVQEVLRLTRINDLAIEDPPMDQIVQAIYADAESTPAPEALAP
ncbi:MAG: ATP-binding cassette domain-containing protein [Myxococcota bacterium]|nr:ATP-binding cassette domain-containing protein [Myxococcota bacterium]